MKIDPIIPIWLMAVISLAIIALKRKGVLPYIRQVLIALLLFVINLRIMVPNGEFESSTIETNAYVIFVVDNTVSMYADDCTDGMTRREAIAQDAAYIIEGLPGAHFSTITFGNTATLLSPLTPNGSYEASMIRSIKPVEYYYATGTSLNTPHDLLKDELEDIEKNYDGAYVTVFFLSDGENTSDEDQQSYKDLADYIDNGAVLGYGTTSGSTMQVPDPYDETTINTIEDTSGNAAVSKMDESNLKALAKDLNLDYIHMTSSGQIDSTLTDIQKSVAESGEVTKTIQGYDDIYYWFAIPLALLLGWEAVSLGQSRYNRKRRKNEVKADEPQA